MESYKGKSKCNCGKRAVYRVVHGNRRSFACEEHKARIASIIPNSCSERLSEADYQTWMRI